MKKFYSPCSLIAAGKTFYHFLAVAGFVSMVSLLTGWVAADPSSGPSDHFLSSPGTDQNVSTAVAAAVVEAYKWQVSKDQSNLPKGYFISKDALMWILQDGGHNGVYFYPGYTASGRYCLVAEGGKSEGANYKINQGVDGRRVMSESTCPTDCGALTR